MAPEDGGHRDAAIAALANREYEVAGNRYTRSAWRLLAEPHDTEDPFSPTEQGWVGVGLGHLAVAVVSYRVAGVTDRARHRGTAARALAEDLLTQTDRVVQRGCLYEYIGDVSRFTDTDAESAYDQAVTCYRAAENIDPQRWTTTALFEAIAAPFQQLARGQANGEIAVSWEQLHGPDPDQPGDFLGHRVSTKRQHLPAALEATLTDGYLAAPRGTTAYETDSYQCPACDSRDVNWVGNSTLCLRCSRPMERIDDAE